MMKRVGVMSIKSAEYTLICIGTLLGTGMGFEYVEHPDLIDPKFISDGNFQIETASERYSGIARLKPMYVSVSEKIRR